MRRGPVICKTCLLAALAAALLAAQGCTSIAARATGPADYVGLYLKDRLDDLLEVADVGISVSSKPGFALYGAFSSLTPAGYAMVDGHFLGIGGGQILGLSTDRIEIPRFYVAGAGFVAWGYEELGWYDYDIADMGTLQCQDVGIPGLIAPPYGRPGPWPS